MTPITSTPSRAWPARAEVAVIQRRLTEYRVPLFELMRASLREAGVTLRVLHGDGTPAEREKGDGGSLSWAERLPCRYLAGDRLCWLDFGSATRSADLVVIGQENRLLYNFVALTVARPRRVAFWGHGRNFQARQPRSASERIKRLAATRVDWWFAYNALSARTVTELGFPESRITSLENAIDTCALRARIDAVTPEAIGAWRARHRIAGAEVGLFLGSLYAEKRLDFLLASAERLARSRPSFVLLVVGDGPERSKVLTAAKSHAWIRYLGARHGDEKALALRSADVLMNPGLVGLGILDGFVGGVPLVTTDCGIHSPEIEYLVDGRNGLVTKDDVEAFTGAVSRVLDDEPFRTRLARGALDAGKRYTIENMAARFTDGILRALRESA